MLPAELPRFFGREPASSAACSRARPVAGRDGPAVPPRLAPGLARVVGPPLGDPAALELGEHHQDLGEHPAGRSGEIDALAHGDNGLAPALAPLHQPGEVQQRPAQPVQLGHHDRVPLAGPAVQPRPEIIAGERADGAADVDVLGDRHQRVPAPCHLMLDRLGLHLDAGTGVAGLAEPRYPENPHVIDCTKAR
jgi:hypothetical protein